MTAIILGISFMGYLAVLTYEFWLDLQDPDVMQWEDDE